MKWDGSPTACFWCGTIVRAVGDISVPAEIRWQDVIDGEWHSCPSSAENPDRSAQILGGQFICDSEKLARECAELGITVIYPT